MNLKEPASASLEEAIQKAIKDPECRTKPVPSEFPGLREEWVEMTTSAMLRIADHAAELERERCAKIAEAYRREETSRCRCYEQIAAAIRRGE